MATLKATTWAAADRLLGDRSEVVLGNNTTAERDGSDVVVRLHGHAIACLLADGSVLVRDCNYITRTTYSRLNAFAPAGWRLRYRVGGGFAESVRSVGVVVHGTDWLRLEAGGFGGYTV